mgnify:FL=1
MNQLELFDVVLHHYDEGLECNKCSMTLPLDNFNSITYASGTIEYKRICRTCQRNQSQLIAYLKSTNAYPPDDYVCPICQRDIVEIGRKGQKKLQSWVLDHCHDTETFRGWVCHQCNEGDGAFKDDVNSMKQAVD